MKKLLLVALIGLAGCQERTKIIPIEQGTVVVMERWPISDTTEYQLCALKDTTFIRLQRRFLIPFVPKEKTFVDIFYAAYYPFYPKRRAAYTIIPDSY